MLIFAEVLRPSTLLRYCGQVFLLLAGSSPATYFLCWRWWSITNIYIRCILWKAIDEFSKKEATLPFHQQKKRPTYGVVEGEKGSRW
jgi:hypothetical protein